MIETTWEDVVGFARSIVSLLWIPLAAAIGGIALAVAWVTSRIIARRLERRYSPGVARWSRRRAGLATDARVWACPACNSINPPTVAACYHCGLSRPRDAHELLDAGTNPDIFHPREPTNQFDPSLYRGPGAPAPSPGRPAPSPSPPAPSEPPSREAT